ncbi:hypothetical protein SAMN05444858_13438 [Micromonospora avicenniae]|uniref:Uncharacterized protein n=1 Tax=Micromonospora avicenniae TaxID=1198245 RepID=A0A1N7FE73_9ACTN|nr:hypothetical protein SAMN05444858_13438 [Micromonospora avicenniae]
MDGGRPLRARLSLVVPAAGAAVTAPDVTGREPPDPATHSGLLDPIRSALAKAGCGELSGVPVRRCHTRWRSHRRCQGVSTARGR